MRIALEIIVWLFVAVCTVMLIFYSVNIHLSRKYFSRREKTIDNIETKINMIVILPCLREQNVIAGSLDYFYRMSTNNVNLYVLVACTKRELSSNKSYGFEQSSAEIARDFIKQNVATNGACAYVYEANDFDRGDRATQMNYAVDSFLSEHPDIKIDIIAAFDADSRPTPETFDEVAAKFMKNPAVSYQQPDEYIGSAHSIWKNDKKLLASANAVYQNEWTMITEIPMLVKYGRSNGKYKGYFYCNGHGEFFPLTVWKKIRFPEHEITDGIHIGYRLGMAGFPVEILDNYGNTDAPHSIRQLPKQHKRWFGGCMRLLSCYKWCKENGYKPKKTMVISGLWSQFRWAFTANIYLICLAMSIVLAVLYHSFFPLYSMILIFVIYFYVLGTISLLLSPSKNKVGFLSVLMVPIAMYVKSIGPQIYIFEKIFRRKQVYEKVER